MQLKTIWPEDAAVARRRIIAEAEGVIGDDEGTQGSDAEAEARLAEGARALADWMQRRPHLPSRLTPNVDEDRWLRNYLLMNKASVERAKAALEEYFSVRWRLPEAFDGMSSGADTQRMRDSFDNTCLAFMPNLTKEGHRVVVYSHFTPDSTNFNTQELAARLFAVSELCLSEAVDRASDILVLDLKNTRLSHLAKYNLAFMKVLFDHAWKAYPERVAAIHIVNPPPVMDATLVLFKPFLKQKIRDRIKIHDSVDRLKEHVPIASLPSDYGGAGPSCRDMNEAWRLKMVEKRELLRAVATQHRSDERLRPADCTNGQEHANKKGVTSWTDLGMEGSFRKLSLD